MQTNDVTNLIEDLPNDDRAEVASVITDALPMLNTTKLVEIDDATNDRAKGGRLKDKSSKKIRCLRVAATDFVNEVAAKHDTEKKNCTKNFRKG